jgi:hypothetical protein
LAAGHQKKKNLYKNKCFSAYFGTLLRGSRPLRRVARRVAEAEAKVSAGTKGEVPGIPPLRAPPVENPDGDGIEDVMVYNAIRSAK